jgi:hypothetical protein
VTGHGIERGKADPARVEIGESGWLVCALLWVIAGASAISPLTIAARSGRLLLELMLLVQLIEAAYVAVSSGTTATLSDFAAGCRPKEVCMSYGRRRKGYRRITLSPAT